MGHWRLFHSQAATSLLQNFLRSADEAPTINLAVLPIPVTVKEKLFLMGAVKRTRKKTLAAAMAVMVVILLVLHKAAEQAPTPAINP